MTSISGQGSSIALSVLQSSAGQAGTKAKMGTMGFVTSDKFSVSSGEAYNAIVNILQNPKTSGDMLNTAKSMMSEDSRLTGDNAKHHALADIIMQNRGDFPPESFLITTHLPGGGSVGTHIPAANSVHKA